MFCYFRITRRCMETVLKQTQFIRKKLSPLLHLASSETVTVVIIVIRFIAVQYRSIIFKFKVMCGNSIQRQFIAAGMLLFKMLTQSILSKDFYFAKNLLQSSNSSFVINASSVLVYICSIIMAFLFWGGKCYVLAFVCNCF